MARKGKSQSKGAHNFAHNYDNYRAFKYQVQPDGTVFKFFKKGSRWYRISDEKYLELMK